MCVSSNGGLHYLTITALTDRCELSGIFQVIVWATALIWIKVSRECHCGDDGNGSVYQHVVGELTRCHHFNTAVRSQKAVQPLCFDTGMI